MMYPVHHMMYPVHHIMYPIHHMMATPIHHMMNKFFNSWAIKNQRYSEFVEKRYPSYNVPHPSYDVPLSII